MKHKSFSRSGKSSQLNRTFDHQRASPLAQSRDGAIMHIKNYSNLLDTYGPSEKLTQYLILNHRKPIHELVDESRLGEQLMRLDRVKNFQEMLDLHPKTQLKQFDKQILSHLRDLKQIYPSLEQNKFMQLHDKPTKQQSQQPTMRHNRYQNRRIFSEDPDVGQDYTRLRRLISVPEITQRFLQRRGLSNHKKEYQNYMSVQDSQYKPIVSPKHDQYKKTIHAQSGRLVPTDELKFESDLKGYTSVVNLVGTINQIYGESQKISSQYRDIEARLIQPNPPPVMRHERRSQDLYDSTFKFLTLTHNNKKVPHLRTLQKLPFNLRMNRLYPIQSVYRGNAVD